MEVVDTCWRRHGSEELHGGACGRICHAVAGLAVWMAIAVMSASSILVENGAFGRSERDATEKQWNAQWITAPGVAERDSAVLRFRKVVDLAQPVAHFVVNVSADNQFIFYVNGKEAGRGPSRADLGQWR